MHRHLLKCVKKPTINFIVGFFNAALGNQHKRILHAAMPCKFVPLIMIFSQNRLIVIYRITTPQGSSPTLISAAIVLVAVSITDTEFERPFATYNFLPSGVIAIFHGRFPTDIVAITLLVAWSIT